MTRIDHELSNAFSVGEAEAAAVDLDAVYAGVERHITRRRRARVVGVGVVAATAVLAVATLPALLGVGPRAPGQRAAAPGTGSPAASVPTAAPSESAKRTDPSKPAPERPAFGLMLSAGQGGVIEWYASSARTQKIQYRFDHRTFFVDVYAPGDFDPASISRTAKSVKADAVAVQVGGVEGYCVAVPGQSSWCFWRYASDGWAMISGRNDETSNVLVRAAESVVIGPPVEARLPFKLGYVPAGLRPTGVEPIMNCETGPERTVHVLDMAQAAYAIPGPAKKALTILAAYGDHNVCDVGSVDGVEPTTTTVAGRPAKRAPGMLSVDMGGWWLTVGTGGDLVLSEAELERIVRGATVARDVKDRSTWFDASSALPGEPYESP